jgi:cytochrome c oxidase cbb3-type subunit 4
MDLAMFHAYWTVLLFIIFVGIWIWAWSAKRKSSFDEAARMVLDDDNDTAPSQAVVGEKKHG